LFCSLQGAHHEAQKSMDVIVPDDQLSLAIGRRGQNVRLAVQLTEWRIDIKSETAIAIYEALIDADIKMPVPFSNVSYLGTPPGNG